MKTAAIFTSLFVLIQARYSQYFPNEMMESFDRCVTKLNLDRDTIFEANKKVLLDENDENMIKFYDCHTQDMGLMDSNGKYVFDQIEWATELRLKHWLKDDPDGDSKAHRIASEAVEYCKNYSPLASSAGLRGIKMRTCLRTYVADTHLLS